MEISICGKVSLHKNGMPACHSLERGNPVFFFELIYTNLEVRENFLKIATTRHCSR